MYTYDGIHEPKQFKYEVSQNITENLIEYSFISKGERNILKVVQYHLFNELNGRKLFNFGFGDYNFEDGIPADHVISNNGDTYKVFNTVLSTVPRFFEIHNNAIMMVKGSDSGLTFADECRTSCRKNCTDICRNANRRINIYRGYVNKHYDALKRDYTFYGNVDVIDNEFSMIDYEPGNKQPSIVLMKNKNQHHMITKTAENPTQEQELKEPTSAEEMMALYQKIAKGPNRPRFTESNERARQYIEECILRDKERQAKKLNN